MANGFYLSGNMIEILESLPQNQILPFIQALDEFRQTGELPSDPMLKTLVIAVKPSLESRRPGAPTGNKNAQKSADIQNESETNKTIQNNSKQLKQLKTNTDKKNNLLNTTTTTTTTTKNSLSSKSSSAPPDFDPCEIGDSWNRLAVRYKLSQIQAVGSDRLSKFRARFHDSGCTSVAEFFERLDGFIRDSLFLQGREMKPDGDGWMFVDRDWRADFDFFLQKKSFRKTWEGSYDDPDVRRRKQQGGAQC